MPNKVGEYEIILGTFNDNKFTWHHVDNYKDLSKAYKAYKDYVNSQLKYTDEELLKVWNTGRLDIELRKGNRLLNWVGVYSREVDRLANAKESDKKDKKDKSDKKDDKKKDTKAKDSNGVMFDEESGLYYVIRNGYEYGYRSTEAIKRDDEDSKTNPQFNRLESGRYVNAVRVKDSDDESPWKAGSLVKVKPEWLDKGERGIPYMLIEDRGDRVLVKELREYSKHPLLGTWVWPKKTMYLVDGDLMMKDSFKREDWRHMELYYEIPGTSLGLYFDDAESGKFTKLSIWDTTYTGRFDIERDIEDGGAWCGTISFEATFDFAHPEKNYDDEIFDSLDLTLEQYKLSPFKEESTIKLTDDEKQRVVNFVNSLFKNEEFIKELSKGVEDLLLESSYNDDLFYESEELDKQDYQDYQDY